MKSINYLKEQKRHIICSVFIRNLFFFIPLITDALYMSNISPEGIAGIGVITPLLFFISLFQKSVSQSIVIRAQQCNVGENDKNKNEEIKNLLTINFYWLLGISLLASIFFPVFISYINRNFLKLEYDAGIVIQIYSIWISPQIFFAGFWIYCNAVFKIFFKPQYATKIVFWGVILNVILNTVFMLVLIDDAYSSAKYLALATSISSFVTIICGLYYVWKDYRNVISIHIARLFDWKYIKSIFKSSAVILFESVSSSIVFNIFIIYIAKYGSNILVAFSFSQVCISVNNAWINAVHYWNQSYISQMIPVNKKIINRNVYNYFIKNFLFFEIMAIGISILVILTYVFIIRKFIDHNPIIVRYVIVFFIVDMGIQIGRMFNMSNVSVLLLIKKNKYVLWSTFIVKYFLFLFPLYLNNIIFDTQFIMIPIILYILDEYIRGFVNFFGARHDITIEYTKI